jgi:hypothetical protein
MGEHVLDHLDDDGGRERRVIDLAEPFDPVVVTSLRKMK